MSLFREDGIRHPLLLRRVLGLVWGSAPGWTTANAALLVLQSLLPVAALYLTKLTVDAAAEGARSGRFDPAHLFLLVGALAAIALAQGLCSSLASLAGEAQGQAVTDHVQSAIHERSVAVDLSYYEDPRYHDTLHRAQQEAPYRPARIVNGLTQTGLGLCSLLAVAGLLLSLHWLIAAVLLVATVPALYVRLSYSRKLYRWHAGSVSAERQASYFSWLLVGEPYAKEVRLLDLGRYFIGRFRDVRAELRRERFKLVARRAIAELAMQSAATAAVFGALGYLVYETAAGAVTVGSLVMYYQAFQRGQGYLRDVISGVAGLYEDSLFVADLYAFLDLRPVITAPPAPRTVPRPIRQGIVFDRVSFHYPGHDRMVLDEISLTLRAGERIALVGENGAGKSTLVKLLCRLYDPVSGRITIDGIDVREYDVAALRREISVHFQDFAHYQLSVRETIGLGDRMAAAERGRIEQAARDAGADEVIRRLPGGLDAVLGNWFDGGQELSIGEWQKLALARTFFRDSQIVALDEPTSSLDASAEHAVLQAFDRLAAGKTTILISHRLSTARTADRICLLAGGRIAEQGTHDELMRRRGAYARLFELQAMRYRGTD